MVGPIDGASELDGAAFGVGGLIGVDTGLELGSDGSGRGRGFGRRREINGGDLLDGDFASTVLMGF